MLARGLGLEAAATHLGHTSKAITEGHYVEPDQSVDFKAADVLEATLRPVDPDGGLLARPEVDDEEQLLDQIDPHETEVADAAVMGRARPPVS